MRRIALVMLFVVLGLGAVAMAAARIGADEPVYDFGEILEGLAVVHTFVLQNVGDEPLTIDDIQVSCGCTTTSLAKSTLAPGESVDLEVTFDSAGFGGKMTKNIYVKSNDPSTPKFTLRLTGKVRSPEPYNIAVSDLNYLFYLLVDLRTPQEYDTSHLLGAINIPYKELADWAGRLPKRVLIILYDEDGTLSDKAAQMLNETGFPEAKSLLGGLNEWTRQFKDKFIHYETAG